MIGYYNYLLSYLNRGLVDETKLGQVVERLKSNKVLGSNKIINYIVKLVISILGKELEYLFIACLELRYHL